MRSCSIGMTQLLCLFVYWGFRARRLHGHFAPITPVFMWLIRGKNHREIDTPMKAKILPSCTQRESSARRRWRDIVGECNRGSVNVFQRTVDMPAKRERLSEAHYSGDTQVCPLRAANIRE